MYVLLIGHFTGAQQDGSALGPSGNLPYKFIK